MIFIDGGILFAAYGIAGILAIVFVVLGKGEFGMKVLEDSESLRL